MPLVCIVSNSVSFIHIGYVSYAKMKMCYLVTYFSCNVFRRSAKKLFSQKSEITMEVGGWVLVSLGIPLVIFWSNILCEFFLYALLKVVGYYDLSVMSMSVMDFPKKFGWLYPIFLGILGIV